MNSLDVGKRRKTSGINNLNCIPLLMSTATVYQHNCVYFVSGKKLHGSSPADAVVRQTQYQNFYIQEDYGIYTRTYKRFLACTSFLKTQASFLFWWQGDATVSSNPASGVMTTTHEANRPVSVCQSHAGWVVKQSPSHPPHACESSWWTAQNDHFSSCFHLHLATRI